MLVSGQVLKKEGWPGPGIGQHVPRDSCLVSGTKNAIKRAPREVRMPKKMYVP
jgi:hypothetical protein